MNHAAVAITVAIGIGCAPQMHGSAMPSRITADGGTLILDRGNLSYSRSEALQDALTQIRHHCGDAYEVTAIELVPLGSTSYSSAVGGAGWAAGETSSSPNLVQAVTYLCRRPASTMLNDRLAAYIRSHPVPPPPPPPPPVVHGTCETNLDCDVGICYEGKCRR